MLVGLAYGKRELGNPSLQKGIERADGGERRGGIRELGGGELAGERAEDARPRRQAVYVRRCLHRPRPSLVPASGRRGLDVANEAVAEADTYPRCELTGF